MLIIIAILLAIIASTLLFGAHVTLIALGVLGALCLLIVGVKVALEKNPAWLLVAGMMALCLGALAVLPH